VDADATRRSARLFLQISKRPGRLRISDIRVVPLRKIKDVGSLEPAWNPGGRTTYSVGGGSYVEVRKTFGRWRQCGPRWGTGW
jgi:hypothetical protein